MTIRMTPERKGYPRAVRDAILSIDENKYNYILFMDGDGQYYIEDVEKLIKLLLIDNKNYDIIVGMRTKRVEPLYRRILTRGLRFLEKILFNPKIKDVTSALRLMKTNIAQKITSQVKYSRYNFWLEFTARMSNMNDLNILEIPVGYKKREEGESQVYSPRKIFKIVWAEFKALVKVWLENNWKTLSKFAFVGATGAMVILFFTWFLTEFLSLWYMISAAIAIELSILWAFALNTKITFNYKFNSIGETFRALIRYHLTAMGGLIINLIVLYTLTEFIGFYYLLSEFIAIVVAFGFNYLASVMWVWR